MSEAGTDNFTGFDADFLQFEPFPMHFWLIFWRKIETQTFWKQNLRTQKKLLGSGSKLRKFERPGSQNLCLNAALKLPQAKFRVQFVNF